MVIYIDVLILINLYVTYFEISSVCLLTHRRVNNIRIIIGSAIGGAASLTIFIPQDMTLLLTVIKLALCFVITFAVFGKSKTSDFFRALLFLLLVNFVFSGLMLCIWLFAAPMNMLFINGTVYFGIDVLTVLVCTAVSYLLLRAIRLILDKNGRCDRKYKVVISNLGKMCSLCALADSGNGMVDYFSGLPVIICRKENCADISPPCVNTIYETKDLSDISPSDLKGLRILPFSTVGKNGMACTFKADSILIIDEQSGKEYNVNALIGIVLGGNQEYEAVFNPKILV